MLLKHGKSLAMCPQDCDKDWRWVISGQTRIGLSLNIHNNHLKCLCGSYKFSFYNFV